MTDRNQLIVVLGMHRSGTSVLARGLKSLGVELGHNLLPAMANVNERGFWEDQDFLAIDVELMELSGLDWYDNCPEGRFEAGDPRLESYAERALQLLKDRLAAYPCFAIKDPRMAVLMPFWRTVFERAGCDVRYVIALRNPKSVVESVCRRDGFGAVKVYYLWLEHVLPSLLETIGQPCLVVDYDLFMNDAGSQLNRMAKWLELPKEGVNESATRQFVEGFLSAELVHCRYEPEDLKRDPAAPPEIAEIYSCLSDMAADRRTVDDNEVIGLFERCRARYRAMAHLFPYINDLERRLRRLKEGGAKAEILALEQVRLEMEKRQFALEKDLAQCVNQNQSLRQRLAEFDGSKIWRWTAPMRGWTRKR